MTISKFGTILLFVAATGCATGEDANPMEGTAERYVKLVLALGHHDADYVDAYYGPQEWRDEVDADSASLSSIRARAENLRDHLAEMSVPTDELDRLHISYLRTQVNALIARDTALTGAVGFHRIDVPITISVGHKCEHTTVVRPDW